MSMDKSRLAEASRWAGILAAEGWHKAAALLSDLAAEVVRLQDAQEAAMRKIRRQRTRGEK